MSYGFWFDPTIKTSNVDSTVQGNKFLNKYWDVSSSTSEPMGTDITPKQVFSGDPYSSLYGGYSDTSSNSSANTIFNSYLNKDYSSINSGGVNPPVQGTNGENYSSYNDLIDNHNSYMQNPDNTSNTKAPNIFNSYYEKDYSKINSGEINPPVQGTNGENYSSYQDLIDSNNKANQNQNNANNSNGTNNNNGNASNNNTNNTQDKRHPYGFFDSYMNGDKYQTSSTLSSPLYVGNGESVSSYADLINNFNNYMSQN